MKRDLAVPALAAVLALLVLPATGLLAAGLLPTTPGAYHRLALLVCVGFFLAVAPARRLAWRPLMLLLAALPFLFFGYFEGLAGAAGPWVPTVGWFALLAAVLVFGRARTPWVPAAALAILLGCATVLAAADLPLLPAGWNALSDPLPAVRLEDAAAQSAPGEARVGVRVGAPLRVGAGEVPVLGSGPGPWWTRATQAAHPGPRPVVLLLDGSRHARARAGTKGVTLVPGYAHPFSHVFDLAAFDALIVRSGAWAKDDPQGRLKARAIAAFVRRGGLLVGPAPAGAWPPALGRALGAPGRQRETGLRSKRSLGLGWVARAATQADVSALLEAGLWVPAVSSRLAAPTSPPPLPRGLVRWRDRPEERRPQGVLLLVYAAVLLALGPLLRRRGAQALGILLAAGAVMAGLAWVSVDAAGFRAHALVTEVGGRRVEAVVLVAGPRGYEGRVRFSGGGVVSLVGGRLSADGRVQVAPGRTAWVLRESEAKGPTALDEEDRRAALLRPLLVGQVDPRRLRYGREPSLPVQVEGVGRLPAWTVRVR